MSNSNGRKRYVLEGEWSGYHAGQRRVVHRVAIVGEKRAMKYDGTTIGFTDNTTLFVSVRPAEPREKVVAIHGYDSLISDVERAGRLGKFTSVRDLDKVRR